MNAPCLDEISASPGKFDAFQNLLRYGLTDAFRSKFIKIASVDQKLVPGRVARIDGISTLVCASGIEFRAVSTFARFAHGDGFDTQPVQPAVGDWVLVRPGSDNEPDSIELVLPRESLLIRKRARRGKEVGDEQILAANITVAFVVQSATYFNTSRLEREIALVWGSGATPVVVLTKIDLIEHAKESILSDLIEQSRVVSPGIEVFAVSGITGAGLSSLFQYTRAGETVILLGASGVGKSTLVNQLAGEEVMDTGKVRGADARGRHTTSTRQLLALPNGGVLIDTPGIRSISLASGNEKALEKTFSDVEQFFGHCRFRDCAHQEEPGCVVVEAIADGRLSKSRFDSYLQMKRELQLGSARHGSTSKTVQQPKIQIKSKGMGQKN